MGPADRRDNSEASKRASAGHVLRGYLERRRHRRGPDTFFGSADVLRAAVEQGIPSEELDRRRSSILAEAQEEGMSPELAELLYDIALDEGLDPALGFELVRTGLGVAPPPEGISTASAEPASDKYLPNWMFPATPPDELLRERMLRHSFRRLRSFLERTADVGEALRSFADEPDVGHHGY